MSSPRAQFAADDVACEQLDAIEAIAEEYCAQRRAGHPVTPEQIADRHPELRDVLLNRLALVDLLLAAGSPSVDLPTDPGAGSTAQGGVAEAPTVTPEHIGRYEIRGLLGEGASSRVYRAFDPQLRRDVALKVLSRGLFVGAEARERFQRDARAASRLAHPHIVRVNEVGDDDGQQYINMELVEGKTLQQRLARGRPAFRETAEIVRVLADALGYAHSEGVVHRDVKPANVLLDGRRGPQLADFGLARLSEEEVLTKDGRLLGTPAYMSPEQAEDAHRADGRSDIYTLGVVLYEMLAGCRPFADGLASDDSRREDPPLARAHFRDVPQDLATICLKALEFHPARRFQTAGAMAEELRRWLADEPLTIRRRPLWQRAWRWARKNRWEAAVLGLGAGLTVVALLLLNARSAAAVARADMQAARADAQTVRADAAEAESRESRRNAMLQELQRTTLLDRSARWSDRAWGLVQQCAAIRTDHRLRDLAARTLMGMDARLHAHVIGFSASSIAFDADGRRIVAGGWDAEPRHEAQPARFFASTDAAPVHSQRLGAGPVAFVRGVPMQLIVEAGEGRLRAGLWSLEHQRFQHEFAVPPDVTGGLRVGAISPDGSCVAAAIAPASFEADSPATVLVWDIATQELRFQSTAAVSALAISPDSKLLSVGEASGRIVVYSWTDGQQLASLEIGSHQVHALTFARDRRRPQTTPAGDTPLAGWLLAAGDAGGSVVIWDLSHAAPRSYCRGSNFDVYAAAFSPDSSLLASAGRSEVRLWDVATGRLLLMLSPSTAGGEFRNWQTGLAFSPDGKRLAVSCRTIFGYAGGLDVWELEPGRGVSSLHGMLAQVERIVFSQDGRLLAALAHDWQIGVWDVARGELRHVFDAPRGLVADNADITFDPDGQRLAFSTLRDARLWDTGTGQTLRSWELPPGLVDRLAFDADGRLLLFRVETRDGREPPIGEISWREHPRVSRIRDLLAEEPLMPLFESGTHDAGVIDAAGVSRFGLFIADGRSRDGTRSVLALDPLAARVTWSASSTRENGGEVLVDASGRSVALMIHDSDTPTLVDTREGRLLGSLPHSPTGGFRRDHPLWGAVDVGRAGYSLFRRRGQSALVTLGIDQKAAVGVMHVRHERVLAAWGSLDGHLYVADVSQVEERLGDAGLTWPAEK